MRERAEAKTDPDFLPEGRKIYGRKMGNAICFEGTFFCHQFFCQTAFVMLIFVGPGIAHGCGGGQRHVALTPGGDVYACSHARQPEFRLGNLLTDRLADLWSSGPKRLARERYRAACQGVTCPCSRGVPGQ